MRSASVGTLAVSLALALSGCLGAGPVEPTASRGKWTDPDAHPWFGYGRHVGSCGGPPCHAAVVVFEDAGVLWFTWGRHGPVRSADEPEPAPRLQVPDERHREALRSGLLLLGEDLEVRVHEVRSATLTVADHARIMERVLDHAHDAEDPGAVAYDCTDVGRPFVVVRADVDWRVDVAPRGDDCGENEHPQKEWFRIEAQGAALWDWIARAHWWSPESD